MTQTEAAELAGLAARVRWTEYENGTRTIDPARWALWLLATGQHPHAKAQRQATRAAEAAQCSGGQV
jgi:hypothetical protein